MGTQHKITFPYKSKKRSVVWRCNTNGPKMNGI